MATQFRLYVGNFPYDTTETDLKNLFDPRKINVKLILDRETQRPRGFAFVELENVADMKSAIEEFDGVDFGGRKLVVNQAQDKVRTTGGGGGGSGGDRRGNNNRNRHEREDFNDSWKDR